MEKWLRDALSRKEADRRERVAIANAVYIALPKDLNNIWRIDLQQIRATLKETRENTTK